MAPITIQFSERLHRPVKPVNGICNGPIVDMYDFSEEYRELNIPYVRLHDTNYYGKPYFVDISRVFPVFDADETDPKNYRFEHTDQLLASIRAVGAKTIYRLGESIDHTIYKRFARPPEDFEKWARICVNIIRHYNEGWAEGFHYNIRYWEIWNEPECLNGNGEQVMWWGGTQEEAFRLYKTAAAAIKAHDSTLKVGGMAFTAPNAYARAFVKFCGENSLPLDFFSYHKYFDDIEAMAEEACSLREFLTQSGFGSAEIVFDEWNWLGSGLCEGDIWYALLHDKQVRRQNHEKQKGETGASFTAGAMIRMNSAPIDIAAYYDGQCNMLWCGLFDAYGLKQKTYYAFYAYGLLYRESVDTVAVSCPYEGVYAMAAVGNTEDAVLISNYQGGEGTYSVQMNGLKHRTAEIYLLDKEHTFSHIRTEYFGADTVRLNLSLAGQSVVYIRLKDEL